jgi:hypothetical protein
MPPKSSCNLSWDVLSTVDDLNGERPSVDCQNVERRNVKRRNVKRKNVERRNV